MLASMNSFGEEILGPQAVGYVVGQVGGQDGVEHPLDAVKFHVARRGVRTVADQAVVALSLNGELRQLGRIHPEARILLDRVHDDRVGPIRRSVIGDHRLLDDRHQTLQTRPHRLHVTRTHTDGLRIDLEPGVVQQLELHRPAPLLIDVLIGEHLRRGEALLGDRAALGHEPGRAAVIGRINLVRVPDPLSHEHQREHTAAEHVHRDVLGAQISDAVHIGKLRIPHDHLRVLLQRSHHRNQRSIGPLQDLRISRRITQMDRLVGVHVARHRARNR